MVAGRHNFAHAIVLIQRMPTAAKPIAVVMAALALVAVAAAPAAARPAFGVVSQAPLTDRDFARMDRGGVQTLRFVLRRRLVEPARGSYDWSGVDPVVEAAARHRISLLPIVYGSPEWVNPTESHPPLDSAADRAAWRAFLAALVGRYGPGGEFWSGRAGRPHPIRRWQLWNEPNFDFYWDPEPSADEYARLVRISAAAIRGVDPRAKLMLAGVASVRNGLRWWRFLGDLYDHRRIERDFDYVALHPYSPGLTYLRRQINLAREVMRDAGDERTPLAVTELGWASDGDRAAPLVVGPHGQANLLRNSFDLLSGRHPRWRISDVDWYAWQDTEAIEPFCSFCAHAGLFDLDGEAKPAWGAFQAAADR